MMRLGALGVFLHLFLCSCLFAQEYDIQRLGGADGLSQGMVTALCEDSDGFIWVGTLSGLNRYDGRRFKTYLNRVGDPYSPASNRVSNILEDSKGRVWVGFNEGLDCFDRKTGRFHHLGNRYNVLGHSETDAGPVAESADGHIWLYDGFMFVEMTVPWTYPAEPETADDIRFQGFDAHHGLPAFERLIKVKLLPEGRIGAYAPGGGPRVRYDSRSKTWQAVSPLLQPDDIPNAGCEILYDAYRKGYWTRAHRDLSLVKNGQVSQRLILPDYFDSDDMFDINSRMAYCDTRGNIWLIEAGKLYRITPGEIRQGAPARVELVLDEHYYTTLLGDRQGTLWVGTNGYGLVHIVPQNRPFTSTLKGISIGQIEPVGSGTAALTVRQDMYIYDVSPSGQLAQRRLMPGGHLITYVLQGHDGVLYSRYLVNNRSFLQIRYPDGRVRDVYIPNDRPNHFDPLILDRQRRLWVSSSTGALYCLPSAADSFLTYDYSALWQNKPTSLLVRQLYQGRNGVLWIATQQGLVELHDPGAAKPVFKLWQHQPGDPKSLSSNAILAVLDDPAEPDRVLWVATNGGGLNCMDKQTGRCRAYSTSAGLPNDVVYAILDDARGRLWMSTNFGLVCFSPKSGHFQHFTVADGLQDNEFNTYAFCKLPDGRLCFGGVNGLTIFHPEGFVAQPKFSPTFFTDLKVNNKTVELRDSTGILREAIEFASKIQLRHDQNFLTVSFVTLDFTKQDSGPFYYKMEGVDPDWVYADGRTELNYPNLSPGQYTLRVASVNGLGERNPQPATLSFIVSPPWWRSWWAWLFYAALAGFTATALVRFQLNRVRLQSALLYREKETQHLQRLDEAKTRFFTNVTHEFRTPLTLILEPVRQLLQRPGLESVRAQHQIIFNNAQRLLLLVNQLLDISKLEAGKLEVHWETGDLLPLIRELYDAFSPLAASRKQRQIWDCAVPRLQGVTDRRILEQILYNLLSNAHKFTPEGGSIYLTVRQPDPATCQVTVRDTGIGIAEDSLPHIFDRFYQVDNALTRQWEGTGIGLAQAKELSALLQATIAVRSTPGIGTTFTLTFPLFPAGTSDIDHARPLHATLNAPIPVEAASASLGAPAGQGPIASVLLVEDNAEMRQYLALVLTQQGYLVAEAENGAVGLEKAREMVPDILITDIMMPEMDGYEMSEQLRNDRITSHIPIVMLTAKGQLESKLEGYKRGAEAYLPKPFYTEELLVRLQQLLEKRLLLQQRYTQCPVQHPEDAAALAAGSEAGLSELDKDWLAGLNRVIRENLPAETFVVDDLPAMFFMSRTQFYAKVKALTGLTPARLLRDARLDMAYHLLRATPGMKVFEVMHAVGLNDAKNFTAIFKERFGVTPRQGAPKSGK